MLHSASHPPVQLLGQAVRRDEPPSQLPSKWKRDTICGLGPSNQPFTIKPYPDSPHNHPVVLRPVRVIGRSQLPLTLLDATPNEHFALNSLFSAQIQVLEEGDAGRDTVSNKKVLIARLDTKRTLYAIEQVHARVYSICGLVPWLQEKDVTALWDPGNLETCVLPVRLLETPSAASAWWQHAVIELQAAQQPAKHARLTMMRRKLEPTMTTPERQHTTQSQYTQDTKALDRVSTDQCLGPAEPLSPHDQLSLLVQQYLEAVYLSKTSLAYFVKGPINRIRNTFTAPEEGSPATHELVAFLRAMLLSSKASEKKYYEKLPAIIKALPPGSLSDHEHMVRVNRAKKSKKKVKLNRDGVYPQEEPIIRKWWLSDLPSGDSVAAESIDQRIRRRIGDLRVRETLAQLILMLEIIALESLYTYKPPLDESRVEKERSHDQDTQPAKSTKRTKKLDDINLQLDLLLDKLCIWHATEEMGILDFDTKPTAQSEDIGGTGKPGASDRLHSFCVEVIVPFYMNRLPEQALMANKKLGGPMHTAPSKRKATKVPTTCRKSAAGKEPDVKKPRRSLARAATDHSGSLSQVKREGSEVSLSAIPFQRSPSKSARQSMSQIRHLQGRQIDLNRPSAAAEAKMKHKQRVEEDLQEAILALKKPNRGLAAGGYVADQEERGLGVANKSRKQANPVRRMVKDVQVSATPRRRTQHVLAQTPRHGHVHNPFVTDATDEAVTTRSDFCVPSSAAQRPHAIMVAATGHGSASGRQELAQPSIAETPSKAPNTKSFSSGAARRTIFATPSKPPLSHPDAMVAARLSGFDTDAQASDSSPPALGRGECTKTNIYDALGWNDYDVDDDEAV